MADDGLEQPRPSPRMDRPGTQQGWRRLPLPHLVTLILLICALVPVWVFDRALFSVMNEAHSPATDALWLFFTTLGDGVILAIIIGAFVMVNPRITVLALSVMVLTSLAMHSIKLVAPSPRPAAVFESVHVVGPLLRSGSFPSGHTAASMAAALGIQHLSSRLAGMVALGLALLVSLSRIFVGAHFPKDVVGGTLLALGLFVGVSWLVWPRICQSIPDKPDFSRPWLRILFRVEVGACLYALCIHAPYYAESGLAAAAIALAVLTFLGAQWRKRSTSTW